jgi:hypothetical protein
LLTVSRDNPVLPLTNTFEKGCYGEMTVQGSPQIGSWQSTLRPLVRLSANSKSSLNKKYIYCQIEKKKYL